MPFSGFFILLWRKIENMAKRQEGYPRMKLRTSYISTIVSITLVLYLLGILGVIVLHARKISVLVRENIGFTVFINDNVKEADIKLIQKNLDASKFVKSTEYIDKEKAAKILMTDLGEDFVSFLGYIPLLPSIDVRLKANYTNADSIAKIEQALLKNKQIKEVFYQKSLIEEVNENIKRVSYIILGISVLLLIISFALINNAIRLSVYSKRFIIKSMQLIGATQSFIRRPFIWNGIIQGLIGAALSIAALVGTLRFVHYRFSELINLNEIDLFLLLFAAVLVLGILITWLCTYLAVRKYLKIKTDYLYYF